MTHDAARSHIAVFNVPMTGHVLPTLAVVRQLVLRGHRVSYAVTAEFGDQVRAVGADPVLYDVPSAGEAPEDLAVGVAQAVEVNRAAVPQLEPAFADDRPDLVLYDVYAWAGPMLAAHWGVPAVLLSPSHLPYDGVLSEMFGVDDLTRMPGFADLERAFTAYGVPGGARTMALAPPHAIAFLPRAFQRRPETVRAAEAHWVGPALGDRSFQGSWRAPDNGRPVVYVSLGSQYNHRPEFYRTCAEAFADLGVHVVMSVGAEVARAGIGELPEEFEVHAAVPQLDVLAASSAFVTHGGMGSVMEAVALGVPLVVVPQMTEQRVNAERVQALSLGVYLPREEATGEALRDAVRTVRNNPRVRAALATLGQDISQAGGSSAAADIVEKVLANRPMTP
ncbi:macrolide family glycosyltransferase [Streptomyces sp. NPDC057238]|uniref:macrolide family glycosyltransferase n=1 Tax=Streptomyces sp. NPDC057238 TaxID=3346060 RepID=UPI0036441E49